MFETNGSILFHIFMIKVILSDFDDKYVLFSNVTRRWIDIFKIIPKSHKRWRYGNPFSMFIFSKI